MGSAQKIKHPTEAIGKEQNTAPPHTTIS